MTVVNFEMINDQTACITINRPEASNALSLDVLNHFNDLIEKIERNCSIQSLIITGAGKRSFCAGADLKERSTMSENDVLDNVRYIGETITRVESLPIPVIALINGAALGGGLELALACDIRIAFHHATFGLTETSLAIIPGAGGTQRLSRLIGVGQAKRLIFSSKIIKSDEALKIGLIEEIISETDEMTQTPLIQAINQNGPLALKQAKKAINIGLDVDLKTGLHIEQMCYESILFTEDRIEGLKAFQEKRKPIYRGK